MDTTEIKELFDKTFKTDGIKIIKFGSFRDARYLKHTGTAFTEEMMMNSKSGFLYTLKKIYWMFEGDLHRLDGPSVITDDGGIIWSIDHTPCEEQEFWKHPMVIKNTLEKILLEL